METISLVCSVLSQDGHVLGAVIDRFAVTRLHHVDAGRRHGPQLPVGRRRSGGMACQAARQPRLRRTADDRFRRQRRRLSRGGPGQQRPASAGVSGDSRVVSVADRAVRVAGQCAAGVQRSSQRRRLPAAADADAQARSTDAATSSR